MTHVVAVGDSEWAKQSFYFPGNEQGSRRQTKGGQVGMCVGKCCEDQKAGEGGQNLRGSQFTHEQNFLPWKWWQSRERSQVSCYLTRVSDIVTLPGYWWRATGPDFCAFRRFSVDHGEGAGFLPFSSPHALYSGLWMVYTEDSCHFAIWCFCGHGAFPFLSMELNFYPWGKLVVVPPVGLAFVRAWGVARGYRRLPCSGVCRNLAADCALCSRWHPPIHASTDALFPLAPFPGKAGGLGF